MNAATFQRVCCRSLPFALAFALGAASAAAEHRIHYLVGYGIYSPLISDRDSDTPRTGLLAVNGSHRTVLMLIWAGRDGVPQTDAGNPSGGFVGGDDEVLDSRVIEAGIDGVDEWGYSSLLPPPFVTARTLDGPVYVRVFQDENVGSPTHWYYDSQLFWPRPFGSSPIENAFADVMYVETGGASVPTSGVTLDKVFSMTGGEWIPVGPDPLAIRSLEFDVATSGIAFRIPYSYSFGTVYGATEILPNGQWNWAALAEGVDFDVADGHIVLATRGEGLPTFRVVRVGLVHDF